MDARLLKIIAALLALGAALAAVVGVRLSSSPGQAPAAAPVTYPAVVARNSLAAGRPIAAADVALQALPTRPRRGFVAVEEVVGKVPQAEIAAGETLLASHFVTGGVLAQQVRQGERAVAVKVDDVIGLGGYAQPGDRVDVLLYLRGDRETDNLSTAQVVLRDARLLAFGDAVQSPPEAGEEAQGKEAVAKETMARVGIGQNRDAKRQRPVQSAVLAIAEADAARLMLAASSGTLRLALRPAQSALTPVAAPAAAPPGNELIRLGDLVRTDKRPAASTAHARPGPAIVVYDGDTLRRGGERRNE